MKNDYLQSKIITLVLYNILFHNTTNPKFKIYLGPLGSNSKLLPITCLWVTRLSGLLAEKTFLYVK